MGIRVWYGLSSGYIGDFNHAANWRNENGASSAVPVADDDVYFVSGSQDVQASTVTDLDALDSLNFGGRWTGSFVTTVDPSGGDTTNTTLATATINADSIDYANESGSVALNGTFVTVNVQDTSGSSPALKFGSGSIITNITITGGTGTVLLEGVSVITGAINIIGTSGVTLEIEAGNAVHTADITMDSGRIICAEQIDTVVMYGGTLEMVNVDGETNVITIYDGVCEYKPTGAAVLGELIMYGGRFDMQGCTAPTHTITETTMHSGSIIDERNGLSNTTYTNPILGGGIIRCDLGRQVTVT